MVRTPSFHCREFRAISLVRELRSHKPYGTAKKKKNTDSIQILSPLFPSMDAEFFQSGNVKIYSI